MNHEGYTDWLKAEILRLEQVIRDLEFHITVKKLLTNSKVEWIIKKNKLDAMDFITEEVIKHVKSKLKQPAAKESKTYELLAGANNTLQPAKQTTKDHD